MSVLCAGYYRDSAMEIGIVVAFLVSDMGPLLTAPLNYYPQPHDILKWFISMVNFILHIIEIF